MENDFTVKLNKRHKQTFRSLASDIVLATDLKDHFRILGDFKSKILSNNFDLMEPADRLLLMLVCMKAADLNHPTS